MSYDDVPIESDGEGSGLLISAAHSAHFNMSLALD